MAGSWSGVDSRSTIGQYSAYFSDRNQPYNRSRVGLFSNWLLHLVYSNWTVWLLLEVLHAFDACRHTCVFVLCAAHITIPRTVRFGGICCVSARSGVACGCLLDQAGEWNPMLMLRRSVFSESKPAASELVG